MAQSILTETISAALIRVDTPTICNAIEWVAGKRGFADFTRATMVASDPGAPPMLGFAHTAQIAAAEPPDAPPAEVKARRLAYFKAMTTGPQPAIAVIEDLDFPDCVGAWWGEVHSNVHQALGVRGAVTNGVVRDLGDLAPGFPILAGSVGPSHAHVHLRRIGGPVTVMGLEIAEGDLIHADRHGAVVIPPESLDALPVAIAALEASEALILGPAREPDFDLEKLRAAWDAFEASRI